MNIFTEEKVDISQLVAVLHHLHPMSIGAIEFLQSRATHITCRKGRMLLREGNICDHLYFIKKGAIRGFVNDGKKDVTTWISVENELVTSISGLNDRKASPENMQAIEYCDLLSITMDDLEELYIQFPEFNITGRKLLQRYYFDAESRAFICRIGGAEQKYQHFVNRYPHLINRVSIKFIASFLGVALETLSRVRNRISK